MIGERILNYQIESLIGEGGMGKVYLASHTQLGRKVAIKALNPDLVNNAEIRERFRNEAAALSSLQQINIVTLYDYLEEERGLFLIMEYVEGKSLDEYIKTVSGPIAEKKATDFFSQLLDALSYAHQKGIVHRDIKPSNIIVTKDDHIKILDFGIAKILEDGNLNLTKAGNKMGTVLYMSPEQVEGKLSDFRTDIYSLGITLFEVLTGKPVYDEKASTEYEIYNKIVKEPLPRAKDYYPAVSDRLQAIIDKATAKEPGDRFQNCLQFKEALLSNKNIATPKNTVTIDKQETKIKEVSNSGGQSKKRSFPVLAIVLGLIAVIVVIWVWRTSSVNTKKDNNVIAKKDTVKKSVLADDEKIKKKEDKKKEDKSPEEELLDSLNKKKKEIEDDLKDFNKKKEKEIMQSLVVDGQFEDNQSGEFSIQVTLVNLKEGVRFDNIVISIAYFSEKGKEIEVYDYTFGSLKSKENNTFQVKRTVDAAKFTCKIKSADYTDLKAGEEDEGKPEEIVKKEKELKKITEAIKKAEEEREEKEKDKAKK